ncbi:MAG: FkbM family methyltransferase [Candidatus Omnitrophica bacterium]|nr:FkbM family methyltransferase [Candidatus Omnitrophota bacterium]
MNMKRKFFNYVTDIVIKMFRLNTATKFLCSFLEKIDPVYVVENRGIKYFLSCPNDLVRWRAETYFTKEPETIEWVDTFNPGDVLFDIGANVGLYSIYAAKKGIDVVSFEPESQNFALLNKNIYLNKCSNKVTCLNVAISDQNLCDYLYLPQFQAGGAINCFGSPLDEQGKFFAPVFNQGVMSYTLDFFLLQSKFFPTHIKIDVDGIEPKVINGAENTLKDPRLKSLSIELNDELLEHLEVVKKIQLMGFTFKHKKHSVLVDFGKDFKIFNYVFTRT